MALQGTIDSFPIVDVLQLLSTSNKTGRLELVGDRERGTLWMHDGDLVAGIAQGRACGDPAHAVWELLRFSAGSFEFNDGEQPSTPGFERAPVDAMIARATQMLAEWTQIEQRVPSLHHTVGLAVHLPGGEVHLSPDDWALVVGAGPSPAVGTLIDGVGLEEFEGCRRVAEMVDRGLLTVTMPNVGDIRGANEVTSVAAPVPVSAAVPAGFPAQSAVDVSATPQTLLPAEPVPVAAIQVDAAPPVAAQTPEPAMGMGAQEATVAHPAGGQVADQATFPEHFPIDDLVGESDGTWEESAASELHEALSPALVPAAPPAPPEVPAMVAGASGEEDVLAQIGRLSPKAAEAIAAALGDEGDSGPAG